MKAASVVGVLLSAVMILFSPWASANVTWTLAGTGDWSVGTDWSGGAVPTSTDNADISGGTVTITQTGETCGTLWLGSYSGVAGSGVVQMANGSLTISGSADVGYSSPAPSSRPGGTDTIVGQFYVGSGAYSLNGGILNLDALSGTGFNFGGGTLQASGSFTTYSSMTLTGSGGNATVDTAGYTVTLSGSLSGLGRLTKTDNGVLVLAGTNTYGGGTTINGGLLEFASPAAIPSGSGSIALSGSGALLVGGLHDGDGLAAAAMTLTRPWLGHWP